MTFLHYKDLKRKGVPFSRVHVGRMVKEGRFPKPVKLGEKENCWIESEIEDWLAERIRARGSQYEPGVHAGWRASAEATD
jgi:prophage regulatory protein